MARKQSTKVKSIVYLTDQSSQNLKELVGYLEDRAGEMEMDEEFSEENGENLLPLIRGLISYLKEEHLEEEDEPAEFAADEEDEEDDYAAEEPDELEFE